jgi:hypothetical protein
MNKKLKSYSFDGFSGIFFIVVVDETVAFADVVFVNGNFATGDCSIGFEVVKEALGAAFFGKIFDEDIVGVCLHIGIVDVWDDSAFFSFNDWESEFIKNLLIYHGILTSSRISEFDECEVEVPVWAPKIEFGLVTS